MSAASIPKSTPLQRRRSLIEQISHRLDKPITIIEYDIIWPEQFSIVHQRIQQALGNRVLAIEHIGSTSVPGLPAKAVIDVDIIIADPTQEADYVPALEAAGFQFVFREPFWYDHRFFDLKNPTRMSMSLHQIVRSICVMLRFVIGCESVRRIGCSMPA